MPYRFRRHESVAVGMQRIAREQIDAALDEIAEAPSAEHETVHQVRKRIKKIRSLLRLFRDELGDAHRAEQDWFRDTARRLSSIRDAESVFEAFEKLRDTAWKSDGSELDPIAQHLRQRRDRIAAAETDVARQLADAALRLQAARERIPDWKLAHSGFTTIEPGFRRAYKLGRMLLDEVQDHPAPDNLHQWRKRVKDHWYHCRLLAGVPGTGLKRRRQQFAELAEILGDLQDLSLLPRALGEIRDIESIDEWKLLAVIERIDHRREWLDQRAIAAGQRLYRVAPRKLSKRLRRNWQDWRQRAHL